MALAEQSFQEEIHPIDMAEHLAEHHDWDFDRIGDDQIAMAVEGQWRTYAITLAWSAGDETLRMICSFEMEPPAERLPALYQTLNDINDQCWAGAFTFWAEQKLMVYRYGLLLTGGQGINPDQVDALIRIALRASERFYPALQLVVWDRQSPRQALQVAIAEAYGRA